MLKLLGPAFLVIGGILLYQAYQAHNSAAGQLTEFFSGSPSDRAMQLGIGGAVCLLVGLAGTAKGFRGGGG